MLICDISGLEALSEGKAPVRIPLPGHDYIAGINLFPSKIIAGDHADYNKYTAKSWAQHILNESKKYPSCSVVSSFSAINSGTPKIRYWFAYFFRGPNAVAKDFDQVKGVQGAYAYNLMIPRSGVE